MKIKNLEDIYELSPMQQGMLFHSLSAPESGVYVELVSCVLQGNLNVSAFKLAWQQVLERHPVGRTSFYWENLEKPVQVVTRHVSLPYEQYDWRGLSAHQQQEQLETLLQAEQKRGFLLSQAPLMRLYLIQLTEESYQFIWSHHHLLLDGWSVSLMLKEVFAFYEAFSRGQDLHIEPSHPYRNYITWLQQQDLAAAETFWQQALKGFTAPTPLSVNTTVPSWLNETKTYEHEQIQLSVTVTAALSTLARQHQLTLNTIVQGVWALLLSRYSGQTDVVFGATVSGRPATLAGVESMVGLFINTLPVRAQVSPETELISWLKQLQAQQVELRQYEYSSLVQVQGWSEVPRGLPLFESIVVFENYPVDASLQQQTGGLEIRDVRGLELTNYPLTVVAAPGTELFLKLSYDSRRFDAATMTRMLGHFQTLLEGIVANPQQRLVDLPLLTEPELKQLLVTWNQTQVDYPNDKCIHQLFEAQVERTPNAIAVVCEDQILTYSELNYRANRLAHYLRSLGVKLETLVGICMERSLSMIVGILGILKAGGAYVPLDPEYPQERLSFMLCDAQISVLLTHQLLLDKLPQHTAQRVCLDTNWHLIEKFSQDNAITDVQASNLAYMIYTSGSTGLPKGVEVVHRSVNRLLFGVNYVHLDATQRFLQLAPISFDASTFEIWGALLHGAKCVLFPGSIPTAKSLRHEIHKHGITVLWLTAALFNSIIDDDPQALSGIKQLLIGGEALSVTHVHKALAALPLTQIINGYGPTESTTFTCCHPIHRQIDATIESIPIGRAIANTQVYILNEYLQPVPVHVPGELHIGGAGLARGYFNRPKLTQEKFIPNPFSTDPDSRLYKTGDQARYLPDGNIQFLGRSDYQVKIRGFRIELREIEALLGQHPAVQETVVIAQEDHLGDHEVGSTGDRYLVAYVVLKQEQVSTTELRRFLQEKLPNYMLPNHFVLLKSLPLTPNGKINRRALPVPEGLRPDLEIAYAMPQNKLEQTIATVWQKALNLEKVGIYDNFFELGGHSLLIIQIQSQLREILQIDFPMLELLRYPTISSLAEYFSQTNNQKTFSHQTEIQAEKLKTGQARLKQRREQIQSK